MDWRRCTPEWSCRRILKLDSQTTAIQTNLMVRQAARIRLPETSPSFKDCGISRSLGR